MLHLKVFENATYQLKKSNKEVNKCKKLNVILHFFYLLQLLFVAAYDYFVNNYFVVVVVVVVAVFFYFERERERERANNGERVLYRKKCLLFFLPAKPDVETGCYCCLM